MSFVSYLTDLLQKKAADLLNSTQNEVSIIS